MNNFSHHQFAHCESGAFSTLITQSGLKLSEPMVFGLASTLSFVYLPIIKLNNLPLVSYREVPKNIVNKLPKLLNIKMVKKHYKTPIKAMEDLDNYLAQGKLVGLQTSVFYLSYFPKDMRFHFNAHNLLVLKKQDEDYLISDPVFDELTLCDYNSLARARFAKGAFAPKGFLYFIKDLPKDINLEPFIKKAIRKNAKKMLSPFPFVGIKGMKTLAKKISKFDSKTPKRYLVNYLTHIVRMQEEIGTGGGGFRYLYAAFLEESYEIIQDERLLKASEILTESGDKLREFALNLVQNCKKIDSFDPKKTSALLIEISQIEKRAFEILKDI